VKKRKGCMTCHGVVPGDFCLEKRIMSFGDVEVEETCCRENACAHGACCGMARQVVRLQLSHSLQLRPTPCNGAEHLPARTLTRNDRLMIPLHGIATNASNFQKLRSDRKLPQLLLLRLHNVLLLLLSDLQRNLHSHQTRHY
jgi:hypothetical protein